MERMEGKRLSRLEINTKSNVIDYTRSRVLPKIGYQRILKAPRQLVIERFDSLANAFSRKYIDDLEHEGLYDNGLTIDGYYMLKRLAEREIV